jgi:hypothetical protein
MMSRDFKFEKRAILGGLLLLIVADVAMGFYSWHISASPSASPQRLAEETGKLKLLRADIDYAEKIATNFPKTVKDCDKFEHDLPPAASASSTFSAELGDISKKAGVQIQGITFKDKELLGRNITQRDMDASISGDYTNVVKFLNGLQRSPNFYVVDSLELGTESSTPNLIRVGVRMRTFFRTAGA